MERQGSIALPERPAAGRLPIPHIDSGRAPAQRRLSSSPVSAGAADIDAVQLIALLNDALATGWVCAMCHQRCCYAIRGGHGRAAAIASRHQVAVELANADRIATRILALGGEPDLDPDRLGARARAMILEHPGAGALHDGGSAAANMAVVCYRDLLNSVGDQDPATRRLLEEILAAEVDHARRIEAAVRTRLEVPP